MGADQSRSRNGRAAAAPRKQCYYSILGIERQATEEEIRKTYKRKALELHPDRNFSDIENATRKFAELQTAYEILMDPQERAWYDSHREQILNGDTDLDEAGPVNRPSSGENVSVTDAQAIFSMMGRFDSSVPTDDSPRGFFGILNAFFNQLAMEEASACEWHGKESIEYPAFGRVNDSYDSTAKPFYNVWSAFHTRKTFAYKDKWRLSEAPDRSTRRAMEKENKASREEGIREFNDAVRSLVGFVRKRDPRYLPNTHSEAERQQILRNSAAAQAARQRAENQKNLAGFVVPDWAQSRDDEWQHEVEFLVSEEEAVEYVYECIVCDKIFKSKKQFDAHEKSKKHMKAQQQLLRRMKKENTDLDLDIPAESSETESASVGHSVQDSDAEVGGVVGAGGQKSERGVRWQSGEDDQDEDDGSRKSGRDEGEVIVAELEDLTIDTPADIKKTAKTKNIRRAARPALAAAEQDVHRCVICDESFGSRTKLFLHIKHVGHAAPVSQTQKRKTDCKKNKR